MADNKSIVRRAFEELFNTGNLAVADQIYAAEYVGHDPALGQELRGPDGFKMYVRMYRNAFPDLQITIDDQVAEDDEVVTRFTARGTQRGELFGIPPTGESVTITGIAVDRLAGGKLVESWSNYDMLGLLRQLGFVLARQSAEAGAEAAEQQVS
jgi:steroid delta-isomerase-like uncharacterized protein